MAQNPGPSPRLSEPPSLEERVATLEDRVDRQHERMDRQDKRMDRQDDRQDALIKWQHIVIGIGLGVTSVLTLIIALWGKLK